MKYICAAYISYFWYVPRMLVGPQQHAESNKFYWHNNKLNDALIDLSKTTLEKFKDFDDQLNIDIDLIKKKLVSMFLLLSL